MTKVETEFQFLGFTCLVRLSVDGYRDFGIVVPKGHPCWDVEDNTLLSYICEMFKVECIYTALEERKDKSEGDRLYLFKPVSDVYIFPDVASAMDNFDIPFPIYQEVLGSLYKLIYSYGEEGAKVITLDYIIGVVKEIICYLYNFYDDTEMYYKDKGFLVGADG